MSLHHVIDSVGLRKRISLPLEGTASQVFLGTGTLDTRWCGAVNSIALISTSVATGTLRAYPAFLPKTVRFDRIGFDLATAGTAGSVARCGIYASSSDTNPFPTRLIYDGGQQTTDVGATYFDTSLSSPLVLQGPAIYWLANLTGTAAPGMRALAQAAVLPLLGWPPTGGANGRTLLTRTFAYAALPNPFGTISSIGTGNPAAVGLRLIP